MSHLPIVGDVARTQRRHAGERTWSGSRYFFWAGIVDAHRQPAGRPHRDRTTNTGGRAGDQGDLPRCFTHRSSRVTIGERGREPSKAERFRAALTRPPRLSIIASSKAALPARGPAVSTEPTARVPRTPHQPAGPQWRPFVVSVLILFWSWPVFAGSRARPLLTFFTNVVLLACFLGMSVGCLAADSRRTICAGLPYCSSS
jgi:hypothetical protein